VPAVFHRTRLVNDGFWWRSDQKICWTVPSLFWGLLFWWMFFDNLYTCILPSPGGEYKTNTVDPPRYESCCCLLQRGSLQIPYKCGLDSPGEGTARPLQPQWIGLNCEVVGQVLHLTCTGGGVRTERPHKIPISVGMQKCRGNLNCLTQHNWIPLTLNTPWPRLALCQVRCHQRKTNACVCVCVSVCMRLRALL